MEKRGNESPRGGILVAGRQQPGREWRGLVSTQRPDITDEEIGMRSYRLRRERAVERALERVRQGLGVQWATLSVADVQSLEWMLGEVWAHLERGQWEDIAFSKLRFAQVAKILEMASDVVHHKRTIGDAIPEVEKLLAGDH